MSEQVPLNQQMEAANEPVSMDQGESSDQQFVKQSIQDMEDEEAMMKDIDDKMAAEEATEGASNEIDTRSIYVGNVDYDATPMELQQHFAPAGEVERVTILLNKFTGSPKGFAYIEFKLKESVAAAVETLDGSQFRDRELKVSAKRTNIPGITSSNRGSGRGGPFRGRGRGGFRGRGRGRGGFRGRGGPRFNPY